MMLRAMNEDVDKTGTRAGSQDNRYFVKSKVPNLFLLMPSGIYYGRVKIKGKVRKTSFETTSFEVAKKSSGSGWKK